MLQVTFGPSDLLLVLLALAFAWSMGAHYTGACMGMPFSSGSIRLWPALILMAIFVLVGATFLSHHVEATVGNNLVARGSIDIRSAIVIVATAFLLTTIYTARKIPTSTIQILVFAVIGTGLAQGAAIRWGTILHLAVLWVLAPVAAFALSYVLTKILSRAVPDSAARPGTIGLLSLLLVLVGVAASLTMGANDVSNATGVFLMTHLFNPALAGLLGGIGLMVGVLTWGQPLLKTVAFDVVNMDLAMASSAQFVQALVVLSAVLTGYFTSMNQALIGAMAGAGLARGRQTVQWPTLYGILRGWAIGPASGLALAFVLTQALRLVGLG